MTTANALGGWRERREEREEETGVMAEIPERDVGEERERNASVHNVVASLSSAECAGRA